VGAPAPGLESGAPVCLPADGTTGAAPLRGAEAGLLDGTTTAPEPGIGVG
jgi:hypothetical protein